jgi:sugar/nucleoside kinase (ribokinase family)
VIVVIGQVGAQRSESGDIEPSGFAAEVALAAAKDGAKVELVSRLGDDLTGDAVVIGLAQAGVGHVATLRDGGAPTWIAAAETADVDDTGSDDGVGRTPSDLDAADIGLALRYLSDYSVIVLAHPHDPGVLDEALGAAGWGSAHLVVVSSPGTEPPLAVPSDAIVVTADRGAEATASRVGRYAAAVDSGAGLDRAYAVLTGANAES